MEEENKKLYKKDKTVIGIGREIRRKESEERKTKIIYQKNRERETRRKWRRRKKKRV